MNKLISFDLWSNMAVIKKPDVNKDMYLTYNILHKPMLLGILGAIIGLDGYKENGKFPQYYERLKHIKVGIQPKQPTNPNFKINYQKTAITYNNSVGYASGEEGGNLIVIEQAVIDPYYRCYLLLNTDNEDEAKLYHAIYNGEAHYIPYLGKNEFQASWINYNGEILVKEYDYLGEKLPEREFTISSIFSDDKKITPILSDPDDPEFISPYFYFENLPYSFHEKLFQYEMKIFKYTNAKLQAGLEKTIIEDLYPIGKNEYIYLF